jgi:hypothetical protein
MSVTEGKTCRIMPSPSSGGTTPVIACFMYLVSDCVKVLSIRKISCTGYVRIGIERVAIAKLVSGEW